MIAGGEEFLSGKVTLLAGDCQERLKDIPDNSIDACVTDPPYHLVSIVKRFGAENAKPALSSSQRRFAKTGYAYSIDGEGKPTPDQYGRLSKGFMGKEWDGGDIAFRPEIWMEVLRVLKPGAHILSFGGTRTYHRMACAIEDAGFEIRDCIQWLYGSGFPKSHNVGRKLDEWDGWGTALKPACELIVLARKPLIGTVAENVLGHGTGALNIDGCRVAIDESVDDPRLGGNGDWSSDKMAKNVYEGGYAGVRVGSSPLGRWPANLIHDGSSEVADLFPVSDGQQGDLIGNNKWERSSPNGIYGKMGPASDFIRRGDGGSAARFFYTAKADADDRIGSKHPTIKPLDLIQYLIRLITPKGGIVLDPFAGSGTAGEAAWREGMRAVLIEREKEYQEDIRRRMSLAMSGPEERARESLKARGLVESDPGPLFR